MRYITRILTLTALLAIGSASISAQGGDFTKGYSFYKQGQYARAAVEFEKIVKENPDYEGGWRVLGDSYLKLKRWGRAAEAFQKAVELDSGRFVSQYGLAIARFNQGQYNEAVATLLRAERHANSPAERHKVHQIRGSAHFNLKNWAKAVNDLQQALQIRRGRSEDHLQLGIAHFHLGNYDRAREHLEQAQSLNSNSKQAKEYLGRLRYQDALEAIDDRQFGRAVTILKDYLASHPTDGDAWFNLGLAHLFAQEHGAAEKALVTSAELSPEHWDTYNRLGYIYEKTGRYQKSLENYKKAYGLNRSGQIEESIERVQERIKRQDTGDRR